MTDTCKRKPKITSNSNITTYCIVQYAIIPTAAMRGREISHEVEYSKIAPIAKITKNGRPI